MPTTDPISGIEYEPNSKFCKDCSATLQRGKGKKMDKASRREREMIAADQKSKELAAQLGIKYNSVSQDPSKKIEPGNKRIGKQMSNVKDKLSDIPSWEAAMKYTSQDELGNVRKYSPKESFFDIGELILHPKFGYGFITEVISEDKISVLFKDNERILVHNMM